jgi:serine/threonine protein kinase
MEGQVIGNYRVVRKLTEGGMGTVYEAVHDRLGKRAALKTLHPEFARRPEFVQRLIDEARAVSLVEHPGLVEVFDCGLDENATAYILMEYLNGETLGQRLKALHGRGRLELSVTLRICRQIASALAATHEKGIIHRDLKPDNIMLVADPEAPGGERAKLLDFGIAKLRAELNESEDTRHVTMAGTLMGTPTYMSPEQCRGSGQVDDRTDVYSLGILLYLLIGGRPPFVADGPGEVMLMHMTQAPPPLSSLAPETPLELVTLVHQMLQKERSDRPSMAEVSGRLLQLCEALDWGGTTGAYAKLSGGPGSAPASSRPPGSGWGGQAAQPPVAAPAAWTGPSQVMPYAHPVASGHGASQQPAFGPKGSSETSFSRGSMHPLGLSTGSHSIHPPPGRRRWFVGVAIVTGFIVAAPLWWLIDQREQRQETEQQELRRRETTSVREREVRPSSPPPASAPAPSPVSPPPVAASPSPPPAPEVVAEKPSPPAREVSAAGSSSTEAAESSGGKSSRRSDRHAAAAEATAPKPSRSSHRSSSSESKEGGDELLDLLDRRAQPSGTPATNKAKPRAASPTRANAKEKAHVDPSLF